MVLKEIPSHMSWKKGSKILKKGSWIFRIKLKNLQKNSVAISKALSWEYCKLTEVPKIMSKCWVRLDNSITSKLYCIYSVYQSVSAKCIVGRSCAPPLKWTVMWPNPVGTSNVKKHKLTHIKLDYLKGLGEEASMALRPACTVIAIWIKGRLLSACPDILYQYP